MPLAARILLWLVLATLIGGTFLLSDFGPKPSKAINHPDAVPAAAKKNQQDDDDDNECRGVHAASSRSRRLEAAFRAEFSRLPRYYPNAQIRQRAET
jgi:hypothetical protein